MENNTSSIPNVIIKAEKLSNITVELYQLKMLKVGSSYFASIVSQLIISSLIILLTVFASTGIALYLNNAFNSKYIGFFFVSGAYLLLTIILILFRRVIIKQPVQNSVIRRTLNRLL